MRITFLLFGVVAVGCTREHATTSYVPSPPVDPRGCLAATLLHEEHTDDADGVSHDVHYSEHFVRCEGNVWTARVLPRSAPTQRAHGHREMPPLHQMARLVSRSDDGRAQLSLVSSEQQEVIAIGRESEDSMRFDGDFDAAWYLLPRRAVDGMEYVQGESAPEGAEWREKKTADGSVRVLWSTRYDVPLQIASVSAGGAKRDRVSLTLDTLPVDGALPWRSASSYAHATDQDFMD